MIQLDFNRTEQEKLNRLQTVFSRNRRLMRLYSAYLSDSPNLVTKDMTDSLGRDCGVSVSYAYASCLSFFSVWIRSTVRRTADLNANT